MSRSSGVMSSASGSHLRHPVAARVILAGDAELLQPAQDDVVAAVVVLLGEGDEPGAADRVDRRPSLVIGFPPRAQQHHADDPVAGQRVGDHLPVARLEDVQRQEHVREQHDVRQREDRDGGEGACGLHSASVSKASGDQWTVRVFLSI